MIKKDKKKIGRPPAISSNEELIELRSAYLTKCRDEELMPNKAGFCVFLGIHRETYSQYKNKPEFSDTLKALEADIEEAWVQRLSSNAPTGAIFYLKNAFKEHYKDRQETDITSKGERMVFMPAEILNKHKLDDSSPSDTELSS